MSADRDEILRVSDELSQMKLHGASQMVCRLARQRDEAREQICKLRDALIIVRQTDGWQAMACSVLDTIDSILAETE